MAVAKRDPNRVPTLIGVDSSDVTKTALVAVDTATDRLLVSAVITAGGGGGTEYTEGDTDATITGSAIMWEDTSDTLRAVSAAKPLPVDIQNASIAVTGTFFQGTQPISAAALPLPSGAATSAKQLADGHNVTIDNIATNEVFVRGGGTAGSPTDGEVVAVQGIAGGTAMAVDTELPAAVALDDTTSNPTTPIVGAALMGWDSGASQWERLKTNESGILAVKIDSEAAGLATSAKQLAAGHEVSIGAATTDAGDLAKAEDAVHASGDVGVMSLGVRKDTPATLAADGDYTPFQTDSKGAIWVHEEPSLIDTGNSTTSTLTGGSVFTGTGKDVLNYQAITIQLDASHNSATDGMTFQFSTDNSNWDDVYNFTYTAADGARRFQFPVTAQYFRVVYTNGGTNQTHFRVQTILHHTTPLTTIHRLVEDTNNDRSAILVKSAIIAQKGGGGPGAGDFIAVQSTAAGNLKMSVQEVSDGLDVGAGNAAAETQRVSISTDDVNLSAIKTAVEGTLTISGTVTANAGTNLNTSALATSANQLADGHNVTIDNAIGAGVYIRPGTSAVFSVDDNSSSLTVDTTGTAGLEVVQGTAADLNMTEASASAIKTAVEAIDGAIIGPGEPTIDSYAHIAINLTTGANQLLVASAANKQIWVYGVSFTLSVAGTVSFQDEDDAAVTGIMDFATNSGLGIPTSGNFAMPIWKLATDKDLEVDVVTANIDGWLDYAIVSV